MSASNVARRYTSGAMPDSSTRGLIQVQRIVLFCVVIIAGCVNPRAVMVNDAGNEVTCQSTGFGLISGTMANNAYEACVSDAQKRGYHFKEKK